MDLSVIECILCTKNLSVTFCRVFFGTRLNGFSGCLYCYNQMTRHLPALLQLNSDLVHFVWLLVSFVGSKHHYIVTFCLTC